MPAAIEPEQRVLETFGESAGTFRDNAARLAPVIARGARMMIDALLAGRRILACGNGGSAADAQHFSAEMLNRFEAERPPLPAIALTADTSTLTSIANDYRYEDVFAKQILALGQPGDILLAITTSGNSPNVLAAVRATHGRDMLCVALNGRDGGRLSPILRPADADVVVQGRNTARIQEVHAIVIHCLCDLIDHHLLGN